MSQTRPFLTAQWRELLLLNFEVPPAVVERYVPTGTELDLYEGQAWLSIVAFMFSDTRLMGIPIPGHRTFEEVNLRLYVRRIVDGAVRRGVVFVREIVGRPAVTAVARWVYGENYITMRMQHTNRLSGAKLSAGDRLAYAWQTARAQAPRWNLAAGRVAARPCRPADGSLAEFIIDRQLGYVASRGRSTSEYRVDHRPWLVAAADQVVWDCDLAAVYPAPLVKYLDTEPASTFVADGSEVAVYPKTVLECDSMVAKASSPQAVGQ